MKRVIALLSAIAAHTLLSGCAPLPPIPPESAAVQQCLVCRHKRDFSCLDVTKIPGTPHTRYGGRDYWFCSESCRRSFDQNPKIFTRAVPSTPRTPKLSYPTP